MSEMIEIHIGLCRHGAGRVHDILTPCHGHDDLRVPVSLEESPKEWLTKALETARPNFDIAEPMVAEVNQLIASFALGGPEQ